MRRSEGRDVPISNILTSAGDGHVALDQKPIGRVVPMAPRAILLIAKYPDRYWSDRYAQAAFLRES